LTLENYFVFLRAVIKATRHDCLLLLLKIRVIFSIKWSLGVPPKKRYSLPPQTLKHISPPLRGESVNASGGFILIEVEKKADFN
jgi:hypothetical protein